MAPPIPRGSAVLGRCRRTRRALLVLAALLSICALGIAAPVASAVVTRLSSGARVGYQPIRGALPALGLAGPLSKHGSNLEYHGGPVMPTNTDYTVYWAPSKAPAYPAEYQSGLNQFFEDLAHDSGGKQNVDSVSTQYGDSAAQFATYNVHFGGQLIDTDPYPKNGCKAAPICLTDAQLQTELASYIAAHALPRDLSHEYFLLTPPGVEDCFEASGFECSVGTTAPAYCAYHGSFASGGGKIVYSNDPYVTGNVSCDQGEHPNGKPSDGALNGGLSHEHNESITDPELNAWYGPEGYEIGDKCRTFEEATEFGPPLGKAPDGSNYNQLINGREYWYQQEWSNEGSECRQRLAASPPTLSKLSVKKGPAAGGTAVTITGSSFGGPIAVDFGATPALEVKAESATSITAVSPPGSTGTVDVRVTTPSGTTPVVSGDRFKFGPPTIAVLSPASGPLEGATKVTITGSGFALGAATTFKFGQAPAAGVICTSSSTCTATTPVASKAAGVLVIAVSGGKHSKKTKPAAVFSYS